MHCAYPCLHPGCNFQAPTAESLDLHIRAHFNDPSSVRCGFHPFVSLAAVYAAAGLQNNPAGSSYSDLTANNAGGLELVESLVCRRDAASGSEAR